MCVCVSTAPGVCVCVRTWMGQMQRTKFNCWLYSVYDKKKNQNCFFFLQKRYPIMVKCLNIGKNIGKPIYRSISTPDTCCVHHPHRLPLSVRFRNCSLSEMNVESWTDSPDLPTPQQPDRLCLESFWSEVETIRSDSEPDSRRRDSRQSEGEAETRPVPLNQIRDGPYVTLEHKPVLSRWGIFVAIAKNTLHGSKLYIFILCQKSLGY